MTYAKGAKPDDMFIADDCGCIWKVSRHEFNNEGELFFGCGCDGVANRLNVIVYQSTECEPIRWQ